MLSSFKSNTENLKISVTDMFREILNSKGKSYSPLNREIFRHLCYVTSSNDNEFLSLKMVNKKFFNDESNNSDIIISYKSKENCFNQSSFSKSLNDEAAKKIILLTDPANKKKVEAYNEQFGAIFYDEQVLIIPKRLNLGNKFTLYFRFYNVMIDTSSYHTLFQSAMGIGGLIVIDNNWSTVGCFTEANDLKNSQNFISSEIDLKRPEYNKQWINIAMSYNKGKESKSENSNWGELIFYLNGERQSDHKYINLPNNIQYIGNSANYDEPFGVVADIRVYRNFYDDKFIKHLYNIDKKRELQDTTESEGNNIFLFIAKKYFKETITWLINTKDTTEETVYYCVKLLNNIFFKNPDKTFARSYAFIFRVNELYLICKKNETKKEIAKLLYNLE